MGTRSGFSGNVPGWLRRRRHPRLSGTLRIRDAVGRDLTIPLRGRAAVLTTGGTGLTGHGEVWAVHTDPDATVTSLMICYGRTDSPGDRESGLCPSGATVTLAGTQFTWHCPTTSPEPGPAAASIPHPRPAATAPRPDGATAEVSDTADAAAGGTVNAATTGSHRAASSGADGGSRDTDSTTTNRRRDTDSAATNQSRDTGNIAPSAGRDPGSGRNVRPPLPRTGNSRVTPSGLRQPSPET
ncbi:hypothetical protein ACTOB_006008 [Actinoplanes oblitus]|uniref:Uncharacterized protein n=1 Tax=Actinoplanes oblitus TaxID=3040509 RepID=A0ABY8WA87_9ACTN|nr:hypothetical protein [Actinoplanes oblitus]WIM94008.1 hypothetical protein ACTOB_006008 [Actinoplanes oblitus]